MNAQQMVDAVRDNCQIFLNDSPMTDGFADDLVTPSGTSILSVVNREYRRCTALGFLQCYKTLTLVPGTQEYRLDFSFTYVYEAAITDLNSRVYELVRTSKIELNQQYLYWRNWGQHRPLRYYFVGSLLGFDYTPDQAYGLTLLADVLPVDMVVETDTPTLLEEALHDSLVDMASYNLASKLIVLQTKGDAQSSAVIRFKYLQGVAQEGKDYIKRVANGRRTGNSRSPMVQDNYRSPFGSVGVRY